MTLRLLPSGTLPEARIVLFARGLRALGDGYMSLALPFYLTLLGMSALEVGVLVTTALFGAGAMTLATGFVAHRLGARKLLLAAALLSAATGATLLLARDFWPLLIVMLLGTLNPSGGDATLFAPLEHALLSANAPASARTALFARYGVVGALLVAIGAQAAALPSLFESLFGLSILVGLQAMFALYALIGIVNFAAYRRLSRSAVPASTARAPLRESRKTVFRLAALFSLDAFGGGFVAQSLIALWLFQRFELSIAAAGTIFFWMGLLTALSQLTSPVVAARLGLVRTMVYTHVPANVLLALVPFMPTLTLAIVLLYVRAFFSSMDIPARTSYVMAVVTPAERPAAASLTTVPRSLAGAASPALAGYMLSVSSFGWPLVVAGALKLVYDVCLLALFRRVQPPEERDGTP